MLVPRVAAASAARPMWTLAIVLVAAGFLFAGFGFAETARIQDVFTPSGLPEADAQREMAAVFEDGQPVFVMLRQEDPRAPQALRDADAVRLALGDAEGVRGAFGLSSLVATEARAPLASLSDAEIRDALARVEAARPASVARVVTADAALLILDVAPDADPAEVAAAIDARVAASWTGAPGDAFGLGAPYAEAEAQKAGGQDVGLLMPISIGVMLVVLALLFRRVKDVALPFAVVLLALGMSYATLPWLGIPLSPLLFSVAPLLLGIGIDYVLHVMFAFRRAGPTASAASRMGTAAREVGTPVAFTALTTLIGFGSFLLSPVPQIRHWGALVGLGAVYAFLLSFTLLPALYGFGRDAPRASNKGSFLDAASARLPRLVDHRRPALALLLVLTLAAGAFATQVDIDPTLGVEVEEGSELGVRQGAFQERFGGSGVAWVLVRAPADANMAPLDDLTRALQGVEGVGRVDSTTGRARAASPDGALDGATYETMVDDSPDLAQDGYTRVQVSYPLDREEEVVSGIVAAVAASALDATPTGRGVVSVVSQEAILDSLITSTLAALGLVLVALIVLFRDLKWSLLAFAPLLVVLVWQFGLQALLGIPLNPVTGVTTAMVIGVGVDYSLHVAERARRARREGKDALGAAREALRHVGPPVLAGTLTTVAAFAVLGLSRSSQLEQFGRVASIVVVVSFVVAVVLIPGIVAWRAPRADAAAPKAATTEP